MLGSGRGTDSLGGTGSIGSGTDPELESGVGSGSADTEGEGIVDSEDTEVGSGTGVEGAEIDNLIDVTMMDRPVRAVEDLEHSRSQRTEDKSITRS